MFLSSVLLDSGGWSSPQPSRLVVATLPCGTSSTEHVIVLDNITIGLELVLAALTDEDFVLKPLTEGDAAGVRVAALIDVDQRHELADVSAQPNDLLKIVLEEISEAAARRPHMLSTPQAKESS